MEVVGSGKVKIAINARYKLADAAAAHIALEGRETTGATVLLP
jgi:NADPH2:quinone reductase